MIPEEAVQAAAQAIHAEGWTCEAHEPVGLDQCARCAHSTPKLAAKALEAAMPYLEAALRKQIAEEEQRAFSQAARRRSAEVITTRIKEENR